ncbi:hypothetical protein OROGR_028252 [Orobanche gracilis]
MGCISYAIPRFISPTITVSPPLKLLIPSFCRDRRLTTSAPPAVHPALRLSEREEISSTQLVAREYADLNLPNICQVFQDVGHGRIRQHVNPLRSSLMVSAEVPNWNAVYEDTTLPLMIDIGSGSGRFLIWLARRNPGLRNFLGLEIRPKLVTQSMRSFIQCPDPHFKKRHHKRRVVQKPLVESIVDGLVPGGQVFIQSDVLEVALDMRDYFDAESDKLTHIDSINPHVLCDCDGWLSNNPMGIRTEREIHAEFEGARIFRRMYQKQT